MPLSLYFKDGRAKVEIAMARGKKEYDKRHTLREQQDNREAAARDVGLAAQAPPLRPARGSAAGIAAGWSWLVLG